MNWLDPIVVVSLALVAANVVLICVTWRYTRATRMMADVASKDYVARNTPLLEVAHGFSPGEEPFRYCGTVTLINRGAVAIQVEEVRIRIGETELSRQGPMILGIGDRRAIELTIDIADAGWEQMQGREADFVAQLRYIGFEGRPQSATFPLPRPWRERT